MSDYKSTVVQKAAKELNELLGSVKDKRAVLRSPTLTALYDHIKTLPSGKARADFGKEVNQLKAELEQKIREATQPAEKLAPIDVTAPFDINIAPELRPSLLPAENGSRHPITTEIERIVDIFG